MKKHTKHRDSALEEVELENHSFFSFFDASMQLVIDSSTRNNHQTYIISILIYSIFILLFTLVCPKAKIEKNFIIPVDSFQKQNYQISLNTKGINIQGKTVRASFSATRIHPHHLKSRNQHELRRNRYRYAKQFIKYYQNFSYWCAFRFSAQINVTYLQNDAIISHKSFNSKNNQLHFSHHHLSSDNFDLFDIFNEDANELQINLIINGRVDSLQQLCFVVSVDNHLNAIFEKYYFLTLSVLSLIANCYLLFNCQRRYEQIGTIFYFFLFFLTSLTMFLSFDLTWRLLSKIMIVYLEVYMLYLISFIANKHRSGIIYCTFLLIAISFIADLIHVNFSRGLLFDIIDEHHVFWHFITIAVSLSTTAAMFYNADDHPAFILYTVCLVLAFLSVFVSDDIVRFFPTLENFINLKIFFMSVNSIIVLILFIYHRTSAL